MNKILLSIVLMSSAHLSFAQEATLLTDEIIVDSEETGKSWSAEISMNHEIWQKPTCSAYTMSEDGQSTLEVVAYYDAASDSFSEPEVNVVTQANFSFLDVVASTSGSSKKFQLLPVQPNNTQLVGARVLFDDREDLVRAIRRHNTLTARYMDTAGEVQSLSFSLRGSSSAVSEQFSRCNLEFLPELKLPELF